MSSSVSRAESHPDPQGSWKELRGEDFHYPLNLNGASLEEARKFDEWFREFDGHGNNHRITFDDCSIHYRYSRFYAWVSTSKNSPKSKLEAGHLEDLISLAREYNETILYYE